jgi:hypothetical protein
MMLKSVFFIQLLFSTMLIKLGLMQLLRRDDTLNDLDALGVGAMMPQDLADKKATIHSEMFGI